jgi:hypothetical protein
MLLASALLNGFDASFLDQANLQRRSPNYEDKIEERQIIPA